MGPFQIISNYYKPWNISLEEFKISIIDFINFSKNKWNYYNNNSNLKSRFNIPYLELNYNTTFDIKQIQLHSILYNWVRKNTTLDNNLFANSNLNKNIISKTDWILTYYIKILNWEINN